MNSGAEVSDFSQQKQVFTGFTSVTKVIVVLAAHA